MGKVNPQHTALLITGTVVPNSIYVAHADAAQRRNEYVDALKYYSETFAGYPIYFLENSGYDFTADAAFMELVSGRSIGLVTFPRSNMYDKGKGYQEFEMLDAAVTQLPAEISLLVKITGRYKVSNLEELMADTCAGFTGDSQKKFKVVQTNVFICTRQFYNSAIRGMYREADDSTGMFIEKVLYKKFFSGDRSRLELFRKNPAIAGISGSYGGTLRRNPFKLVVRNLERRLLRTLGIKRFLIEY